MNERTIRNGKKDWFGGENRTPMFGSWGAGSCNPTIGAVGYGDDGVGPGGRLPETHG